jgi:hypothetical protein
MTGRSRALHGAGLDRLFPVDEDGPAPLAGVPWARAPRRIDLQDYDRAVVAALLSRRPELVEVDPLLVSANQPSVTRAGVHYYLTAGLYERAGRTYADREKVANRYPLVYDREDGTRVLLAGHHRASAALLKGRTFRARLVRGPWGPPRQTGGST